MGSRRYQKLRAYHFLLKTDPDLLFRINRALADCNTITGLSNYNPLTCLPKRIQYNLAINQFVFNRIGAIPLNSKILSAIGGKKKLAYPLPQTWQSLIENLGIPVNKSKSTFLWVKFVLFNFFTGISFVLIVYKKMFSRPTAINMTGGVHLFDASPSIIGTGDGQEKNFINWLVSLFEKENEHIDTITHPAECKDFNIGNIRIQKIKEWWMPSPVSISKKITFFIWSIWGVLLSACQLLFGKWANALMFREIVKAKLFTIANETQICKRYFFSNSLYLYRPLWTYAAEQRKAEIVLYFYATNTESFKSAKGYNPDLPGWTNATWPIYYVWDTYQQAFLDRACLSKKRIKIVGAIYYEDDQEHLNLPDGFNISLFDVTPFRLDRYCELGIPSWNDYYRATTNNKFFNDIIEVTHDLGCQLNWKAKRGYSAVHDKSYITTMNKLVLSKQINIIPPSVSAFRLIHQSNMVISLPFTSTSLIARYSNIPTIFYDPLGVLDQSDRAAHGVIIISSKNDLKKWITFNIQNKIYEKNAN